ncbi:hypothetical protein ACJA3J_13175 [Halobacillus sp. SY10]|uniref:Uncharacterized protein n=2 Tax=Halobacillus TaxID=45667 RepID=A0A1H0LH46_HALAD|nr:MULTISPECIES: hypothetical protein [Halobacillus]RDY69028.1 hypothetical protein DXT76_17155 [Halobacillus trueperi]SDO67240.1 hypothetical protein SAMN05421677_10717 [Halobacillus aidingensis]
MRVLLELVRIVFLFIFGGALVWVVLGPFYNVHPLSGEYQWLGAVGVYGILFVLYRNRWQFSGWYKGKGKKKLSRSMTRIIVFGSVLLLASPWVIAIINH